MDRRSAFVSSANFTEAAQVRNVEVGVLVRSEAFARKLAHRLEALAEAGCVGRVPGTAREGAGKRVGQARPGA